MSTCRFSHSFLPFGFSHSVSVHLADFSRLCACVSDGVCTTLLRSFVPFAVLSVRVHCMIVDIKCTMSFLSFLFLLSPSLPLVLSLGRLCLLCIFVFNNFLLYCCCCCWRCPHSTVVSDFSPCSSSHGFGCCQLAIWKQFQLIFPLTFRMHRAFTD